MIRMSPSLAGGAVEVTAKPINRWTDKLFLAINTPVPLTREEPTE